MKKLLVIAGLLFISAQLLSQEEKQSRKEKKAARKEAERKRIDQLTRAEEEGILVYSKQKVLGIELRTNGYGFFYEKAKKTTPRNARVYGIEFNEIKDVKEDKLPNGGGFSFGNPYVYGKVNNFYQLQFGYGIQRILGQKGNKNGVAVGWLAKGGFSLGMLRPYYLEVYDNTTGGSKYIKYTPQDSALFVSGGGIIIGSGGIGMGWGEMKFKPGLFARTAIRFDFGKFNEVVSALEVGLSAEFFSSEIPIMLFQDDKKFFYQGHVAFMFGHRK